MVKVSISWPASRAGPPRRDGVRFLEGKLCGSCLHGQMPPFTTRTPSGHAAGWSFLEADLPVTLWVTAAGPSPSRGAEAQRQSMVPPAHPMPERLGVTQAAGLEPALPWPGCLRAAICMALGSSLQ